MTSALAPTLPAASTWTDSATGRFLDALFAAYFEESVRYVVLRNYERWPEDFGKDIDLVVHPNDITLSHAIIRRVARAQGLVPTVRVKRSGHRTYYLAPSPADGVARGVLLDIRPDLVHHGLPYLPGPAVLEHRRREGRFFVPAPAFESLAILLHCVIDVGLVRASYRERLRALGVGDRGQFLAVATELFGATLARRLAESLMANDPSSALRLRRRLLAARVRRQPRALGAWLLARAGAVVDRLAAFVRPPGQIVILVGPDGSGKTTLSTEVVRRFATTRIPASAVYLGAQKPLLPTRRFSQNIRKRLNPTNGPKPVKDVNRRQRLRGLVHIMADKWLRYLVYVRPRLVRGEVVVLDRYFYDLRTYMHPLVQHPVVEGLLMRCIPEPALAFCLVADPAVIAARKHELTTAETARQIALYRGIGRWVRDFYEAPSDGHLPTVVDGMTAHVARVYAESRYPEEV